MSEMQSKDINETAYPVQKHLIILDDHPEQDTILVGDRAGLVGPPHPGLDFLTEGFRAAPVGPPQFQDGSHVSEDFVKRVEERMNGVVLPKYGGGSESELPPTIYRVPQEMKGRYEEAYLPVAVEIGLFMHRKKGEFSRDCVLQEYKWCCVRKLISRHHLLQEPARTPALLRRCLDALKSLEPRIRASYPREQDQVGIRQEVLISMLIDGCFILHRLLKYARIARREATNPTAGTGVEEEEDDDDDWTQVFGRCWVWGFVTCDLLLLENQIPFFVVQKLFEQLRTDPDETSDVLIAGALRLFRSLRPQKLHSLPIACRDVHHLLHLFYLSVGLPAAAPDEPRRHVVPPSELKQWVPCARELEEEGVWIRPRRGAKSFLDVRFHRGFLEIPELQLYDYSEPLFRNLIAFEQTYPFTPGHVTAYAIFMDCLVTSPEDMRLLHFRGVLVNQMNGEREMAGFFGRLCAEAHLAADRNYLAGVIGQVNRYRRSKWQRWRAFVLHQYCEYNPWRDNPWWFVAAFALALTVIQTFFAAYSYFKPPRQQ